jgi:NTF2 fold immunity protein of polymorphic toxin system component
MYGKKIIEAERPFKASLSDRIWQVTGTLHCNDTKGKTTGRMCRWRSNG